jgi:hypothetical protein
VEPSLPSYTTAPQPRLHPAEYEGTKVAVQLKSTLQGQGQGQGQGQVCGVGKPDRCDERVHRVVYVCMEEAQNKQGLFATTSCHGRCHGGLTVS